MKSSSSRWASDAERSRSRANSAAAWAAHRAPWQGPIPTLQRRGFAFATASEILGNEHPCPAASLVTG